MPLDRPAADALGRRLERSAVPSAADLQALAELQSSYLPPIEYVGAELRRVLGTPLAHEGIQLTATSRLKTVATIVAKLRNHETSLGRMRDIGGVRIVGDLHRAAQDRLVEVVSTAFGTGPEHIIDRRLAPRYGYRAVHIVVEVDEHPVEVQVRTRLQHVWANGMERFADLFGRQIRYGGAPDAATLEELDRRTTLIEEYKRQADYIDAWEVAQDSFIRTRQDVSELEDAVELAGGVPRAEYAGRLLEELRDRHLGARRSLEEANLQLTEHLDRISQLIQGTFGSAST